mmetsp:Transcript_28041/g.94170  ORF Transcript_28041/g.94170 Transcript_28041/m.94170 type:complete len:1051 (+) Transcript_28041:106-3258(+)
MALSILLAAVTDLEGCVRKEDVPFISVTRNDLGLSQQRCDTNFCWKKVTSPVPALPAGTPHLAYETDVDQLCTSETDAGVIIVGAPASLQPDDQFSSISMQVRRNCDLFARMLVGRGGLRINATQVAGVKCVFLGDGSSQLQVTNATSRLLHSEAGGFASADFLLGPYGSGLTSYASKQAVADGTVMVAPAASDHAVYSSAAALAQEDGLQPLVFGLLSGSENWARRGFEAVLKAAEDCDTGCEQGKSCSCRDECGERARARTCLTSLRVGYVQEENAFRGTVCSSAQREWGDAKARILTAPAAAAGTGVVANATVPKWGSVDGEEYRREMRRALAHLRGEGATVVLVCSYEAGGIVAVEELERLGLEEEEDFSPLATILTTTVINDEYARKMRGGWWQGEYALQAVPWDASMPSDVGHFSGWNSSTYAEEFMSAFGGHAEYPAKVDYVGAATFAALCTLGAAIERAGSLETAAVASALRSTSLVEFFTSNISFNADGQMEGMDFPVVQYPPGAASLGLRYEVVFDAKEQERVSFPTPRWKLRKCANEGNCTAGNGTCLADGRCSCLPGRRGDLCEAVEGSSAWDRVKVKLITALASALVALCLCACLVYVRLQRRRRHLKGIIRDAERDFARWEPALESARSRSLLSRGGTLHRSVSRRVTRAKPRPRDNKARVISAMGLPDGRYHVFLSHVWSSGQDQAKALKGQLQRYVQNISPFLDVDNLDDTARLEEHVGNSEAVIVLLTGSTAVADGAPASDYMRSRNCLRELRAAVERKRPLILLLETDPSHGGVPLDVHRAECPDELREHVFAAPLVTWHRLRPFQMCSMRLLIAELLRAWKAAGADQPIFLPGDLLRSPPPPLATRKEFHVYYSASNAGAAEVAESIGEASGGRLRSTDDPAQARSTCAFLLYLNSSTFAPGAQAEALGCEVREALEGGRPLVLVHERRDGDVGVATFDDIIAATPAALRDAGIYRPIATPLHGGPHAEVSLRLVLGQIDALCGPRRGGLLSDALNLTEKLTGLDLDDDGHVGSEQSAREAKGAKSDHVAK